VPSLLGPVDNVDEVGQVVGGNAGEDGERPPRRRQIRSVLRICDGLARVPDVWQAGRTLVGMSGETSDLAGLFTVVDVHTVDVETERGWVRVDMDETGLRVRPEASEAL